MKKIVIGFVWLFCIGIGSSFAQNAPVNTAVSIPISKQYDTVKGKIYFLHTVEKGQTLYSIQKAYATNLKEIIKESPDEQLLLGEVLRIPVNAQNSQNTESVKNETASTQSGKSKKAPRVQVKPYTDTLRIALLLPLYLEEVDSIKPLEKFNRFNDKLFTYLSFYEGALLAWNEQESSPSIHFELKVFDVTEDSASVKKILKDPFLLKSNAIISVSFVKSFALLSDFSLKHQIPIIHPLSERERMHPENPYFIQWTPSVNTQMEEWAKYAVNKYPKGNFIVLLDKNSTSNKKAKLFYDYLLTNVHAGKLRSDNVCLYNIADSGFARFPMHLKESRENIVCAFFEKEITFTNTIINLSKSQKKICLLGVEKWLDFDKTEVKYLQRLNFEYYSPFFANYASMDVTTFEANYYQAFKNLPNEMAFKGYDCMHALLNALTLHNTNFILKLDELDYQGLVNTPQFKKRESGGYENTKIHKLKLKDFEFIEQE